MEENIYKNANVVVIDDVEEVLRSVKNCLEFEDMNVECFLNPEEGLEYLKNNRPDVLLLDFFMPQMNGDEFVKKLREYNDETIVILQTGYADKIPPLEMIDKMNIQGYLDKLKGEDELLLMTKAAIKTSFLNKKIVEKEREVARVSYKKAIMGNLIVNLVNEAKDQLMQIGGMNGAIEMNTDEFKVENNGIRNALDKTYKLYEALNFESIENCNFEKFKEIINILLKPTLILNNNTKLEFSNENNEKIIKNIEDNIYFIIKIVEIMVKNNTSNVVIELKVENEETYLEISYSSENDNINLDEIKLLDENRKIIMESNKIDLYL